MKASGKKEASVLTFEWSHVNPVERMRAVRESVMQLWAQRTQQKRFGSIYVSHAYTYIANVTVTQYMHTLGISYILEVVLYVFTSR